MLSAYDEYPIVQSHLATIASKLHDGLVQKNSYLFTEVNNYNKDFIGKSKSELMKVDFKLADAQKTIAQEYGFESWDILMSQKPIDYDQNFERAVDLLLEGEFDLLKNLLSQSPNLIHQRSSYGHNAQLIHYAASNGVELYRQQVPSNLPDLVKLLFEFGADRQSTMSVYGGEFDFVQLIKTSAHPKSAGVLDLTLKVLK